MLLGGVQESPFGNRQPVYTYVNWLPVASSRFLEDSATRQEAYSGCIDPKGLCPLTNPLQPAEGGPCEGTGRQSMARWEFQEIFAIV